MKNKKLTVILPCAGEGTRLGLPYPKEIFAIQYGKSLIDFSIDLFNHSDQNNLDFVITVTPKKLDLIAYLAKYSQKFRFSFTFFNQAYKDFPGSVRSAAHLLGEYNLILLPDTLIKVDYNIYEVLISSLQENECVIFYKRSSDPDYMLTKGCIEVSNFNKLLNYSDKPSSADGFNGVWCGIGFRKDAFDSVIGAVESATFNLENSYELFLKSKMYNAYCIAVDDFIDLGTWPDINAYKLSVLS